MNADRTRPDPELGFQGRSKWHDLSDYLVHFAKDAGGYETMLSILGTGVIKRGEKPFGCAARRKDVDPETQRVVCYSETPLGYLQRLVKRRKTPYGIAFHRQFVIERGGAPLWYLQSGTPQQRAISSMMKRAAKPFQREDPIWSLTPFIDFPTGNPRIYDFQWEREWRLGGDLSFNEEDVAFLFIPEHQHELAWSFFEGARNENVGPGYFCPYVDPLWSIDKVALALKDAGGRSAPPLRPSW